MSRIRSKNTNPELVLRRILFTEGIKGYKLNYPILGKPDIAFPENKIAIFIDGCFWHKCPKCFVKPNANKNFWIQKINSNVKRDKFVVLELRKINWKVIRIWEHEIKIQRILKRKLINKIK